MHTANLTELHDGTGLLQVTDRNESVVAEMDFTPDESGPNRGSLMGTANHLLPDLGWQLDYGWMSERVDEDGCTVHRGKVVRLGERVSVWD